MINVQKYSGLADYLQDQSRPDGECAVSQIGNAVRYDGVNVVLTGDQLNEDSVCCVLADNETGATVYIPVETLDADALDTTRYTLKSHILFGMCNGKKLYIAGVQGSAKWAQDNWYKLECDLTANGGFSWAITINGTDKSGTVAWAAGDTLDSIVTQLQTGAVASRLVFEHKAGEDFIRITVNNYSNSAFTLTNNTGATLTDLSTFCKIGDVQQPSAHRQWQGVGVKTLFAQYPGNAPTTTLYGRNKLNMSYRAGGNLAKYKQYYRGSNGSATYVAEASGRMSEQGFANLNGSGNAAAQALYDKYGGSWDAYMEAGMVWIDTTYRSSMEFKSYNDGKECNDFLVSVTTLNFDGEYVPAFPAAALAAQTTFDGESGCLPTVHELAMMMDDERMARINIGIAATNGTKLTNTASRWSVGEYHAYTAWLYYSTYGNINRTYKSNSYGVRPVLASA